MRYFSILLLLCLLFCGEARGIGRHRRYQGPARSEVELMTRVLGCLQSKDTIGYYHLFPPFDTLWQMVMHNPDRSPEAIKELNDLREHPTVLINFDPFYNHAIVGRFAYVLKKGDDSGVHWNGLVTQRYELQKQGLSEGMQGLQRIAPERYKGYLFVRDMLGSTTYCITITEIQKIDGYFYGGQVLNVLEANSVDEFLRREENERRYQAKLEQQAIDASSDSVRMADSLKAKLVHTDSMKKDSVITAPAAGIAKTDTAKKNHLLLSVTVADEDTSKTRKEVIDRRYYSGMFDDEIPVKLYIRYMKDPSGKAKSWDALYKFGDMQQYVKLDVSQPSEGKWLFEEPVATMELELSEKVYTGTWTNGGNQTGYDVVLTQKSISQQKILDLDRILETGTWGKTDEQDIQEKKEPAHDKKEEDSGDQ